MQQTMLPTTVIVTPHIINTDPEGDDSNPQNDLTIGHTIGYNRPDGWKSLYYGQEGNVRTWLAVNGYQQVTRSGLNPIDGRYSRYER
jgi:hypothetical protein